MRGRNDARNQSFAKNFGRNRGVGAKTTDGVWSGEGEAVASDIDDGTTTAISEGGIDGGDFDEEVAENLNTSEGGTRGEDHTLGLEEIEGADGDEGSTNLLLAVGKNADCLASAIGVVGSELDESVGESGETYFCFGVEDHCCAPKLLERRNNLSFQNLVGVEIDTRQEDTLNSHCAEKHSIKLFNVDGVVNDTTIDTNILAGHLRLKLTIPFIKGEFVNIRKVETTGSEDGTDDEDFLAFSNPDEIRNSIEADCTRQGLSNIVVETATTNLPRICVGASFRNVTDGVVIRNEDGDAHVIQGEATDESVAGEVDGVVLWAGLNTNRVFASRVTFDQVNEFVCVLRRRPNTFRNTSGPVRRSIFFTSFIICDDGGELRKIWSQVEDVGAGVGTTRVVEFCSVIKRRPVICDGTKRRRTKDGRESCDGDGFLKTFGTHETTSTNITNRTRPMTVDI